MRERNIDSWIGWALVGLVLIYAALLLIAPIFAIVSGAFRDGIQPVLNTFQRPDAQYALQLTFLLAVTGTIINAVLGLAAAWVLVRHNFPGKRFLYGLVDLPFAVSPVIVGYVMIVLFGRLGWFRDFPIQMVFAWPGMLLVTVFVSLPFVIREVQPTLESLTREQEEAAYTLGASPWLTFRRVVFPAIRPALIFGIILTLARSLGEFGAVAIVGGGIQGSTETATIYVFRSMHDRNDIGAYSMAILLGLIAVGILVTMNRLRPDKRGR